MHPQGGYPQGQQGYAPHAHAMPAMTHMQAHAQPHQPSSASTPYASSASSSRPSASSSGVSSSYDSYLHFLNFCRQQIFSTKMTPDNSGTKEYEEWGHILTMVDATAKRLKDTSNANLQIHKEPQVEHLMAQLRPFKESYQAYVQQRRQAAASQAARNAQTTSGQNNMQQSQHTPQQQQMQRANNNPTAHLPQQPHTNNMHQQHQTHSQSHSHQQQPHQQQHMQQMHSSQMSLQQQQQRQLQQQQQQHQSSHLPRSASQSALHPSQSGGMHSRAHSTEDLQRQAYAQSGGVPLPSPSQQQAQQHHQQQRGASIPTNTNAVLAMDSRMGVSRAPNALPHAASSGAVLTPPSIQTPPSTGYTRPASGPALGTPQMSATVHAAAMHVCRLPAPQATLVASRLRLLAHMIDSPDSCSVHVPPVELPSSLALPQSNMHDPRVKAFQEDIQRSPDWSFGRTDRLYSARLIESKRLQIDFQVVAHLPSGYPSEPPQWDIRAVPGVDLPQSILTSLSAATKHAVGQHSKSHSDKPIRLHVILAIVQQAAGGLVQTMKAAAAAAAGQQRYAQQTGNEHIR